MANQQKIVIYVPKNPNLLKYPCNIKNMLFKIDISILQVYIFSNYEKNEWDDLAHLYRTEQFNEIGILVKKFCVNKY